jgi:hypothetical protein
MGTVLFAGVDFNRTDNQYFRLSSRRLMAVLNGKRPGRR